MLTDALDGVLSAEDQVRFDLHSKACPNCITMLAEAARGRAWLDLLKEAPPEPSSDLLSRILMQTSGLIEADGKASSRPATQAIGGWLTHASEATTILAPAKPAGSYAAYTAGSTPGGKVLPFRTRAFAALHIRSISHTLLQPRLAMTAAMAFFSIALTLNLTGVRLNDFRLSDLKPASLKRNFYEANAHVVRYYDNLRVVYELESRVRDLQRSSEGEDKASTTGSDTPAAAQPSPAAPQGSDQPSPDNKPGDKQPGSQKPDQKQARPRPGPGTSRREYDKKDRMLQVASAQCAPLRLTSTYRISVRLLPSVIEYLPERGLV